MNIAKYLNLPEHIVEIYGQIPRCSMLIKDETFIKIYESNDNFVNNIVFLLNEAHKTTFTLTYYSQKFMIIIFLYYYIDNSMSKSNMNLTNLVNFKNAVNQKLIEIKETYLEEDIDSRRYKFFYKFMYETFEVNKRFMSIKKNKIYRKNILKNYLLSVSRFNKIYYDASNHVKIRYFNSYYDCY